jgi:predicted nucleotidyltransferase
MSDIPQKEKIIQFLTVIFPNATIYLFGSRALGTHKEASDIDIAIDDGRLLSTLEIAQAKNVIEALNIPQMVDIVDFQALPEKMKQDILKEGIIWKSSHETLFFGNLTSKQIT